MTYTELSCRTRTYLLWTARLALVAFVIQLAAVDHWHSDLSGVEGSPAHAEHCHGAGDCSTGGGAAIALSAQPAPLPRSAALTVGLESPTTIAPQTVFFTPPSEPPQAA